MDMALLKKLSIEALMALQEGVKAELDARTVIAPGNIMQFFHPEARRHVRVKVVRVNQKTVSAVEVDDHDKITLKKWKVGKSLLLPVVEPKREPVRKPDPSRNVMATARSDAW